MLFLTTNCQIVSFFLNSQGNKEASHEWTLVGSKEEITFQILLPS